MKCHSIELVKQSSLIKDYRNREESIYKHFHYDPYHLKNFKKRYEYLMEQTYKREQLAEVLLKQNEKWGLTDQVRHHIELLKQPETVVVIGGQQAGLLTGPLYTINKIVSIIVQAKEQSEYLGQPVIPVFWIAGEDHDFEEINHIHTYQHDQLKKHKVDTDALNKTPVSKRPIDSEEMDEWLEQTFSTLKETQYTKELYKLIKSTYQDEDSYVDFFAKLIQKFYASEGLVLVDSDHPDLRQLEKDYFKEMINRQPLIAESVVNQLESLEGQGYTINLDASTEDGHLFYHLNGERLLLEVINGQWVSKDEQITFTQDEILDEVNRHPDRFSNNVVTRPMMQEMVFPVLSFIGGPGEIAYWATLKSAFEACRLQLPIITPRLTMTLFQSKHKPLLERYGMELEKVINEGTTQYKLNWLKRQTSSPVESLIDQVNKEIESIHQPIRKLAAEIQDDLGAYAESNLRIIQSELKKVEKRMLSEVKKKHQHSIDQFNELNDYYYPHRGLQERTWNIIYFMNEYGLELPLQILNVPPRWEQDHLVLEI